MGAPSKAQNITVMRGFCNTWAADSLPLPVRLSQARVWASRMRNESPPLGERLTVPSAAVPTK